MERNQAILTEFQRLTGFETEDSIQILESNDWDLRVRTAHSIRRG